MTNNDILRRLRYLLNFNDHQMFDVFRLTNPEVDKELVSSWLKSNKEAEEDLENKDELDFCDDIYLASFLNGLIIEKRGRKEGADQEIKNEVRLTNNIIFNKLKIAFNLKAEEILEILKLVEFTFSKHELSALFRKPDHKHYRECKDQVLRNFLAGLQVKIRTSENAS